VLANIERALVPSMIRYEIQIGDGGSLGRCYAMSRKN